MCNNPYEVLLNHWDEEIMSNRRETPEETIMYNEILKCIKDKDADERNRLCDILSTGIYSARLQAFIVGIDMGKEIEAVSENMTLKRNGGK